MGGCECTLQAESPDFPPFRQKIQTAAVRTDPYPAAAALNQAIDAIRRDGSRVERLVVKDLEIVTAVPVETVQSPTPEESPPVLDHAGNPIFRKAIGNGESVKSERRFLGMNARGIEKRKQEQALEGEVTKVVLSPELNCNHGCSTRKEEGLRQSCAKM
jgi:hypothetical protein